MLSVSSDAVFCLHRVSAQVAGLSLGGLWLRPAQATDTSPGPRLCGLGWVPRLLAGFLSGCASWWPPSPCAGAGPPPGHLLLRCPARRWALPSLSSLSGLPFGPQSHPAVLFCPHRIRMEGVFVCGGGCCRIPRVRKLLGEHQFLENLM